MEHGEPWELGQLHSSTSAWSRQQGLEVSGGLEAPCLLTLVPTLLVRSLISFFLFLLVESWSGLDAF